MKTRGVPDFLLLFLTLLLVGFGITMVLSASSIFAHTGIYTSKGCPYCNGDELYFFKKQSIWAALGLISMLIAMNIPFSFYKKNFLLIGMVSFIMLVAVLIPGIGTEVKGARSWIQIGALGSMQTSEFAKLGLILYLAAIISKKGEKFQDLKKGLFPPLVVTALFFVLIALQPDLGTAAILLGTAGIILICGGANLKQLFFLTVPPFSFIIATYIAVKPHAMNRLLSFTDPWSDPLNKGYQLTQSYFAMARGGVSGTGYGKSIQKFLYLPEAHTDFIFSIIGEELGFIGIVCFLIVYLLFLLRGVYISLKVKDTFASLAGIGIVTMISLQALINMGGATGTIPITGVPLPLISYGGSSLLVCLIGIGVLLSVSREVNRQRAQELLNSK
ncbi:putative lipid II flippase FtsW [Brevibacillus sp. SYSU BS000544]|uniref:putative lipid II flippase FtsW n=1 Tax=Brevibacillus sp. SYSU BS000544 TaxID=3416443 RepID=UPI003CE484DD